MELQNPSNGGGGGALEDECFFLDAPNDDDEEEEEEEEEEEGYDESSCSTPFVSAPSSPGRDPTSSSSPTSSSAVGFFFSAPASPVHFALASPSDSPTAAADFEFSARFPPSAVASAAGSMSSADELFLNGQIRPMRLASHLLRPQALPPLPDHDPAGDDEEEEEEEERRVERGAAEIGARGRDLKLRSRSIHRRARSHSPLRNAPLHWAVEDGGGPDQEDRSPRDPDPKPIDASAPSVPSAAASRSSSSSSSTSSSSSSSRRSKKWFFLKELLNRSKSEGSGGSKDRFWSSISFSHSSSSSSSKDRPKPPPPTPPPATKTKTKPKPRNPNPPPPMSPASGGAARRRPAAPAPSPHERLYAANRAHAEEMRRRTFLPYRQGLLGCLGFGPRSYGAINGLARGFNAVNVSSR